MIEENYKDLNEQLHTSKTEKKYSKLGNSPTQKFIQKSKHEKTERLNRCVSGKKIESEI